MDEKKEESKQESKQEESTKDDDAGVQPETDSLIEQSNKAAERNEKVLAELKKENDRAEKFAIKRQLAGKGEIASPQTPKISKEQMNTNARIKAVGDASGAKWAKDMEPKQDGK